MKSIISAIAAVALVAPVAPSFGSLGSVVAVALPAALVTLSGTPAEAHGRGGRGHSGGKHAGEQRHAGHTSVNRHVDRYEHRRYGNDNGVDQDADVDVDVDVDVDNNDNDNDVARAVATGKFIRAVDNSISNEDGSIPNQADCIKELHANVTYLHCDGVWYQPQYSGSDVTYVVVAQP